jgi:hypothetical protein
MDSSGKMRYDNKSQSWAVSVALFLSTALLHTNHTKVRALVYKCCQRNHGLSEEALVYALEKALRDGAAPGRKLENGKGITPSMREMLLAKVGTEEVSPHEIAVLPILDIDVKEGIEVKGEHKTSAWACPVGVPRRRPLVKEVAYRIHGLHMGWQWNASSGAFHESEQQIDTKEGVNANADREQRLLLEASHFGFTEQSPPSSHIISSFPVLSPSGYDTRVQDSIDWLHRIGDDGIYELLGIRRTIGSVPYAIPPTWDDLIHAAGQPHPKAIPKPGTSSARSRAPPLTVAARARAKHSHRGSSDQFFGVTKGGSAQQNAETEEVVSKMIREAAWINIHTFTGEGTKTITRSGMNVLEIRVEAGYGARWSAEWIPLSQISNEVQGTVDITSQAGDTEHTYPTNITFRGFLEPHMLDGHERKWRH